MRDGRRPERVRATQHKKHFPRARKTYLQFSQHPVTRVRVLIVVYHVTCIHILSILCRVFLQPRQHHRHTSAVRKLRTRLHVCGAHAKQLRAVVLLNMILRSRIMIACTSARHSVYARGSMRGVRVCNKQHDLSRCSPISAYDSRQVSRVDARDSQFRRQTERTNLFVETRAPTNLGQTQFGDSERDSAAIAQPQRVNNRAISTYCRW